MGKRDKQKYGSLKKIRPMRDRVNSENEHESSLQLEIIDQEDIEEHKDFDYTRGVRKQSPL